MYVQVARTAKVSDLWHYTRKSLIFIMLGLNACTYANASKYGKTFRLKRARRAGSKREFETITHAEAT